MKPRPYTPEQLAERWDCAPAHVRKLITTGQLRAFAIGNRMFRVPEDAVEEFEKGQLAEPSSRQASDAANEDRHSIAAAHRAAKLIRRANIQDA